ncbi:hypothetical protein HOC01_04960 [archaeon]|jgi:hypothetical protein|nr:hypothetical protein [archaeon]MBT6698318.1 hypothetical protein [archaeon]
MGRRVRAILMIAIFLLLVLLVSCSKETTEKQVVECPKVIFDCGKNACSEECGAIATGRGWLVLSSESVNDGTGCLCEFEKV